MSELVPTPAPDSAQVTGSTDWASIAAEIAAEASNETWGSEPSEVAPEAPVEAQAAPEPAAPAEPAPESVGKQILVQARLEKEYRAKEAQLAADRAAFEKERAELQGKLKATDTVSFKEDPVGWLTANGVPREDWVHILEEVYLDLAPAEAAPEARMKQEHKKFRREREAWEKQRTQERQEQEAARQRAHDETVQAGYR